MVYFFADYNFSQQKQPTQPIAKDKKIIGSELDFFGDEEKTIKPVSHQPKKSRKQTEAPAAAVTKQKEKPSKRKPKSESDDDEADEVFLLASLIFVHYGVNPFGVAGKI